MLELEAALDRILAKVPVADRELIRLEDSIGRVILDPVHSLIDLPAFNNSAMDGYAVRAADVGRACRASPVHLRLIGQVPAGASFSGILGPGECVRIFTGSPIPQGANAVVMQEDAEVMPDRETVSFLDSVDPGENVRMRGEDLRSGTSLAGMGEVVTPALQSLMAASGIERVTAGRRPRAGILSTGSELRLAGEALSPGQIYESNRWTLAGLVRAAGASAQVLPIVKDTIGATADALREAFSTCDLVITSGGVSVGEFDFVKDALAQLGEAEQTDSHLDFWRVAIKPGKPFVFGSLGAKLLFGLPGNPVSAFVTFLLLVRPALLRWQGATDLSLPSHSGVLAEPLENPDNRRHFVRVRTDPAGKVRSSGLQASHALRSLAKANGLVDVPPQTHLPEGAVVRVLTF